MVLDPHTLTAFNQSKASRAIDTPRLFLHSLPLRSFTKAILENHSNNKTITTTSRFAPLLRPALGITLVHLFPRLIIDWIGEYEKSVDPRYPRLDIRLRVVHSTASAKYELEINVSFAAV